MIEADGIYYIANVMHDRWSPFARNKVIEQTAEIDDSTRGKHKTALWIEQEPGNGGKESAMISARDLARFGPQFDHPHTDKVIRARPFAAAAEAGNVRIVKGAWNAKYLDELVVFPNGEHDDMVDASSGAFNKLVMRPPTVQFSRPVSRPAVRR